MVRHGVTNPDLGTEVACLTGEQSMDIMVPDQEVEPPVDPYVATFGDLSIDHRRADTNPGDIADEIRRPLSQRYFRLGRRIL